MPILLRLIYKNKKGKILENIGPENLYLPKVNSGKGLREKVVLDALEPELEEYDWSHIGEQEVTVEWLVISLAN